jgi:hypothetical protein
MRPQHLLQLWSTVQGPLHAQGVGSRAEGLHVHFRDSPLAGGQTAGSSF